MADLLILIRNYTLLKHGDQQVSSFSFLLKGTIPFFHSFLFHPSRWEQCPLHSSDSVYVNCIVPCHAVLCQFFTSLTSGPCFSHNPVFLLAFKTHWPAISDHSSKLMQHNLWHFASLLPQLLILSFFLIVGAKITIDNQKGLISNLSGLMAIFNELILLVWAVQALQYRCFSHSA